MNTNKHPLQEGAININRGVYDFLIRKIDFEMHDKMGKDHPI